MEGTGRGGGVVRTGPILRVGEGLINLIWIVSRVFCAGGASLKRPLLEEAHVKVMQKNNIRAFLRFLIDIVHEL